MQNFIRFCTLLLLIVFGAKLYGQAPTCSATVPFYQVDLRGNPTGSWISPGHQRNSNCCGTTAPDRCTSFEILVDTGAAMISFEIASGAIPPGSMFYQINCGPQIAVGQPICISGPGPHYLTFCKPGNNQNTYRVTSIAKPTFPPADTTRIGCSHPIQILGMVESSVTWNSIFPGAPGDYNSYLNCTSGCDTAIYTPAVGAPPMVEYLVCGTPTATSCGYIAVCDTVRIYNQQALTANATPNPAGFCLGGPGVNVTATAAGGLAPYTYTWRDPSLVQVCTGSSCLLTNAGTYSIEVLDQLYDSTWCPATFVSATVIVTSPPVVDAGSDQTLCPSDPVVVLNGSVLNATGGVWSGGSGTYNPGATSLLTGYTPTPAEIAAGQVTLTLTSTGAGGGCTDNSDQVTIFFPPQLTVTVADVNVNCNSSTGTLNAVITGRTSPYSYQWNTGPTSASITTTAGTYCLAVTDSLGCNVSDCGTIFAPAALDIITSSTPCSVNGGSDGTASANVSGGTAPYTYAWSNGGTTAVISGLSYGIYIVTVTDANGCTIVSSVVVNEPRCNGFVVAGSGTNIPCAGDTNGTATATVVSGTPNYSYVWNDALNQTTSTATNLSAGVYQCIVTDAIGCFAAVNVTITQPPQLANTMTHTNATAIGGNDGSATANVTGGTPGYTYTWSNGGTTANISSLTAGTYSVVINDANNCSLADSVLINQPPCSNLTAGVASTNVSCNGGTNGTASAIVLFGTNPISYLWSTGATTSSISGMAAGNYSVTVTDSLNCTTFVNFTITEPAPLSVALAATDIRCDYTNDGTIELTVSGGTFPYTYVWNNGLGTEDQINLSNGTYSVTVTDANGCTTSGSATITRPAALVISSSVTPVTCNGGNNGTVDASVSGGITPYTYSWSSGQTTQDISGLTSGQYLLTVTDANNCVTSPYSSLIDQPDTLKLSAVSAACPVPGSGLSLVSFSATGGNPGQYNYSADGGLTWFGAGVDNVSLPVDSTYTIVVRDTFGCISPASFTLAIAPEVNILSVTFPSCIPDGATTVAVNFSITGGDGSLFSVSVDSGATWLAAGVYSQNLATGSSYDIIAQDSSGCISVTENISISTDIALSGTTSSYIGGYEISCAGTATGSIDLSATGGTGSYSYAWSNSGTSQDINNVIAGSYSVVVTDNSGCADTIAFTLTEPGLLNGTIVSANNYNGYQVSCAGASDGAINLTVAGGVPGYSYLWTNGDTTQDISGLQAGSYSVVILDTNGCQLNANISLTEPALLGVTATQQNVLCNGLSTGSINITTTGGVSPYGFNWSNAATTEDISSLVAGSYSVTVTDLNGCTATGSYSISQPTAVLVTNVVSDFNGYEISCNGDTNGSVDLTTSGGVSPYGYNWTNATTNEDLTSVSAGSYSVTVTDANGCTQVHGFTLTEPTALTGTIASANNFNSYAISCAGNTDGGIDLGVSGGVSTYSYNWSNGGTTQDLSSLAAGSYSVKVTDANGCTYTNSIVLNEPPVLSLTASSQNVLCNGLATGSINLTTTGGVATYSYAWSNSAVTEDLTSLTAGTYSVTITDLNGCTLDSTFSISQPSAVIVTNVVSDFNGYEISCNGGTNGSVDLTTSGGVSPYGYNWTNATTNEDLTSVGAGSYSVTVTDANGCTQVLGFTLTEPTVLSGTIASANNFNSYAISCAGNTDGGIDLGVSGGVITYSYNWSNGGTTQDLSNLTAGSYSVTVTDANGCTYTNSIVLSEPPVLSLTASSQNVLCNGLATGSIDLTTTGGVTTYSYAWSNSAVTEDLTSLTAGTYSVTITDLNGCTLDSTFSISQPTAVLVTNVVSDFNGYEISCNGGTNGSVDLTTSGGVSPYGYNWTNSTTNEDLTSAGAGSYSVTVTDANGCTQVLGFTLTEPTVLTGTIASANNYNGYDISCAGNTDGGIDLNVTGGVTNYTYNWSNSGTTEDLSNLGAGSYSVTVTDANGCTYTNSIALTAPAPLVLAAQTQNVLCNSNATGILDLTTGGGVTPYTFAWSNGATTEDIGFLIAGSYSVTITDVNGCSIDSVFAITEPSALTATATLSDYNGYNVSCFGSADGSIDVAVNGGVPVYAYSWSDGSTNQDLSAVIAGTYTLVITDSNNCTLTQTYTLVQPADLLATLVSVNDFNGYELRCNGDTNAAVDLTVTGGVPSYTFAWSDGSTTEDISNLSPGNYSVTVTDSNGCLNSLAITLSEPPALVNNAVIQDIPCNGYLTGAIDLTTTGGVLPYGYQWSNGELTQDIDSIGAGTYTVLATDANGCTMSGMYNINQYAPVILSESSTMPLCFGDANAGINLSVTGGTAPYSYNWSGGQTSEDLANIPSGTYTVFVTDANNCSAADTVVVVDPPVLSAVTSSPVNAYGYNVSNYGASDGSVDLIVTGGTQPYTYTWNNGSSTQDLSGIPAGTYSVTVTDNNGCVVSDTISLNQPLELQMPTGFSPNGDGSNDYFVVHGIEAFPLNNIEVYNRWGNLVYDSENYINQWNGTNENGEELPDATYFVILNINEGTIVLKGYVDIRR